MAAALEIASTGNDALKLQLLEDCDYSCRMFNTFLFCSEHRVCFVQHLKMWLCITSVNLQQEDFKALPCLEREQ